MERSRPRPVDRAIGVMRSEVAAGLVRLADVERHLDRRGDAVALTFDDGPDAEHTPAILDELAQLGVAATFFMVGYRARAHPQIVRRMIEEGHAVGSHSYSHPLPWGVPLPTLLREYRRGRAEVESASRRAVPLFRPPKGHVDGRGAAAMLAARLRPWLWTIDPGDWKPDVLPSDIVAGTHSLGAGDVVLLHDAIEGPLAPSVVDRSATRTALPALAALAAERGLRFVTLG